MMQRVPLQRLATPVWAPAWEWASLLLLVVFYLFADFLFGEERLSVVNLFGPIWLTAALWLGAIRMVRLDPGAIWIALFWFRVSVGVYFGVGSLVPLFANNETRTYLEQYSMFGGEDIANVNLIVAVGCTIVLLSANGWNALRESGLLPRRRFPQYAPVKSDGREMLWAGLLFLAVGGAAKYLFEVPYMFGLLPYVLPNSVSAVANMTTVAIFFLTAWSREHAPRAFPLVVAFVVFEMIVGLLMLTKAAVIIAWVVFLLALSRKKLTVLRLGCIAVAILLCYAAVVPIVDAGRLELWRRYNSFNGAGLSERIGILSDAIADPGAGRDSNLQRGALRLSYVSVASFAIRQYDFGLPGDSFADIFALFVPRFLWPDKPIVSDIGRSLNYAATGNDNSASSPGVFADAYWNFGWTGVILLMIPLGILLSILSRYALELVRRERWLYFPTVLLAMQVGFRTDGFFALDMIGGTIMVVALHATLKVLERFMFSNFYLPAVRRN